MNKPLDAKTRADLEAQEKPGPWYVLVELNGEPSPEVRGALFDAVHGIYSADTLAEANKVRSFVEDITDEWAWIAIKHASEVE